MVVDAGTMQRIKNCLYDWDADYYTTDEAVDRITLECRNFLHRIAEPYKLGTIVDQIIEQLR